MEGSLKNQYFGDVNDYAKYGLLRALGREMSVAVIWMLTPDDGSSDGRKLQYLASGAGRTHDPELFDWLVAWRDAGMHRDVKRIEESGLLPNCRFFDETVPDDATSRAAWFARAREFARDVDLVFLDPDNGLPVRSVRPGARKWSKYVALEEVRALYEDRHAVLVYQHLARVARPDFLRAQTRVLHELLAVERFHSFSASGWLGLLVDDDTHRSRLERAAHRVMCDWHPAIRVMHHTVIPLHAPVERTAIARAKSERPRSDRQTTSPGFVNRNSQKVVRRTDLPGTDHGQRVYALQCGQCGHQYGTNGSTIYLARCPACQGGARGLPYE